MISIFFPVIQFKNNNNNNKKTNKTNTFVIISLCHPTTHTHNTHTKYTTHNLSPFRRCVFWKTSNKIDTQEKFKTLNQIRIKFNKMKTFKQNNFCVSESYRVILLSPLYLTRVWRNGKSFWKIQNFPLNGIRYSYFFYTFPFKFLSKF